ncbi:sugar phosphate isomerase/epimerase [Bosea sp. FBZP-16]|uniref:sugar phosphate isomerase/epimerase family protein n=1 Tax=Bosea sp. FBZP-16 TaxID=2065382 RepID=UPI0020BE4DEC|nr:sugar phosphate isomerase/epimerase [Bosea sp. FBZP-16]
MSRTSPPLGIAHFSCIEMRPADFVDLAGQVGYASVGLRLHPAFPGAPFYTLAPRSAEMRQTKTALRQAGIGVYDIEFVVLDGAFSPTNLSAVLDSAAELGARRLSVCGDDPDNGRFVANLSALAELTAAVGMAVDLEIMPWRQIGTLETAVRAVAATRMTNVGVLVDALHLARSGGSPGDLIRLPPSMIRSVQLCDAQAERPEDTAALIAEARGGRLLPGFGALPLGDLLGVIPQDAVISVEVPKGAEPGEVHLRALFDATTRILHTRRSAA